MIFLFEAPSFDQFIGRCLILVDDRDFEHNIFHLDDIRVVINTDLFGILFELFLIFYILLIKVFSWLECYYFEDYGIQVFYVFGYLIDTFKYLNSHVKGPINKEN